MNEKLFKIQQELNVPKAQYNSFGGYKFRSCEDILTALKPLLKELKCVILLTDELVYIGERYYIKATAKLADIETEEFVENIAYAREEETKKGMDGSQITGASSSYARKYALNGLFGIDDVKDSDTTNTGVEITSKEEAEEYVISFGKYAGKKMKELPQNYLEWLLENSKDETIKTCADYLVEHLTNAEAEEKMMLMQELSGIMTEKNVDRDKLYKHYKVSSDMELTTDQLRGAIERLNK